MTVHEFTNFILVSAVLNEIMFAICLKKLKGSSEITRRKVLPTRDIFVLPGGSMLMHAKEIYASYFYCKNFFLAFCFLL